MTKLGKYGKLFIWQYWGGVLYELGCRMKEKRRMNCSAIRGRITEISDHITDKIIAKRTAMTKKPVRRAGSFVMAVFVLIYMSASTVWASEPFPFNSFDGEADIVSFANGEENSYDSEEVYSEGLVLKRKIVARGYKDGVGSRAWESPFVLTLRIPDGFEVPEDTEKKDNQKNNI